MNFHQWMWGWEGSCRIFSTNITTGDDESDDESDIESDDESDDDDDNNDNDDDIRSHGWTPTATSSKIFLLTILASMPS